jgi:hypothetical protein
MFYHLTREFITCFIVKWIYLTMQFSNNVFYIYLDANHLIIVHATETYSG